MSPTGPGRWPDGASSQRSLWGMADGRVIAVSVGVARDASWAGRMKRTAIDKRAVTGRVKVAELGLLGDEQADLVNHGGYDKAVYAYAREDLDHWAAELGRPLRDGVFGENLTTRGVDVTGARIGERWRVGSTLFELRGPRIPCGVFRNWLDERGWVKRFAAAERTGVYLRVLQTGELGAGDVIERVHRPDDAPTVGESVRAFYGDADLLRRVLAVPGHSSDWDDRAVKYLGAS